MYKTGLASAQEKLQSAVSEIRRGNEAIQQLQNDVKTCRDKIQSKNEVIRKQEALIQELRSRLADSNREESKLKDEIALGTQKRELLERELNTAKANIAEGADIIQKNQEVITHLNEMINSLQLGGASGGVNSWSTPVQQPKSYQEQKQPEHYTYQTSDRDADKLFSSPQYSHAEESGSFQHTNKLTNKVSPDSITYLKDDVYDRNYSHQSRLKVSTKHFSLSPQQLTSNFDVKEQSQKGFYDGVLDPKYLVPSSEQYKTHSPSTQYISGITRGNRKQPVAYSWQLDDFGREGE